MAKRIDVPGMGIVEFPDNMSDDDISAAIQQNMAPKSEAESKPSDDVPSQISIPGVGKPSLIGMAKGLYNTAKSAFTLPGDVYAGRVDPLSDEGIRRATDFASMAQMGGMPTVARRAATPALSSEKIEAAAGASYDAVRDRARAMSFEMPGRPQPGAMDRMTGAAAKETVEYPYAQATADHVRASLAKAPRELNAQGTHRVIDKIAQAKDMGDLVEARKALGKINREGGDDGFAAGLAKRAVDEALGPEFAGLLNTADHNYAMAMRAAKYEQKIANASKKAANRGSGGNEGNLLRQAVEPLTLEGEKFVSPHVLAAAENVTRPGMGVGILRALSGLDPTSSKLMAAITMNGLNPLTWPTAIVGAGSRAMYDRILRSRAAQVPEAIRSEAPATLAQPGYMPGGLTGMPALNAPNPVMAPLIMNDYQR